MFLLSVHPFNNLGCFYMLEGLVNGSLFSYIYEKLNFVSAYFICILNQSFKSISLWLHNKKIKKKQTILKSYF